MRSRSSRSEVTRREDQRRQQQTLCGDAQERRVGDVVIASRKHGEFERVAREASARHAPGAGHCDDLDEHLLHRECGANFHPQSGFAGAGIRECVHGSRRNLDHIARPGSAGMTPKSEAYNPGNDLKSLGLDRVDMRNRNGSARSQRQVEGEQLAARCARRVCEREVFARDGIFERLAWSDRRVIAHGT